MELPIVELTWTSSVLLTGYRLVRGRSWCWTMIYDPIPEELTAILHEIERAIEAKLYYVAIAVALSVPDICACLELDPEAVWATEKKYTTWWDNNGSNRFKESSRA